MRWAPNGGGPAWALPEQCWAGLCAAAGLGGWLCGRGGRRPGGPPSAEARKALENGCCTSLAELRAAGAEGVVNAWARAGATKPPSAIFHALHVTFDELRLQLPDLAAMGFDAVQVAPAQLSPEGDLRRQWYLRYQPVKYSVIDPRLGGEAALTRLCVEAARLNVTVIADCVFNHAAVVASRREWEAAQKDAELLEELKCRLDRTFGPELNREDFQWPWVCLEGAKWDDPAYTYEGWGCGEWSELRFSDRVLEVHFRHLRLLLKCGVRGFRLDAAKHLRPAHAGRYAALLLGAGAFVYAEVLSTDRRVHGLYEALGSGPARVLSTDYLMAVQLREAARCKCGGGAFPRLAAITGLGADAVRFVRNHDTVLNDGPAICGLDWRSAEEARVAWAYLLARPEASVLVYDEDARVPTVRRALAFRRAVAARARAGAARGGKLAAEAPAVHAELSAWPPPRYDLVLLLLSTSDGTPLGVAALNFAPAAVALRLPWAFAGFDLVEVTDERRPRDLRPPAPGAPGSSVPGYDARFFLVERGSHLALCHEPCAASKSFTLLYFSGWPAPRLHFGLAGHWTESPGWPLRPSGPPPGSSSLGPLGGDAPAGGWWAVQVPITETCGPVEFVPNDGKHSWDHAPDGSNYRVAGPGTYALERGLLRRLGA